MATEKVFVQIDDKVVELTGADKEAFIAQRKADQAELVKQEIVRNEQKALKVSAYTKLGLTEEEINAIL
jgi:hypothetical protein